MLQARPVVVQVPRGSRHVLWDVRVDLLAILINLSWSNTSLPSFLKFNLAAVFIPTFEVIVGGRHVSRYYTVLFEPLQAMKSDPMKSTKNNPIYTI